MRRGIHPGARPRGRPARYPLPRHLRTETLRRLVRRDRGRAEQAEQAASDLQRKLDEQARELAEARARIAELERLLAEAQGKHGDEGGPSETPGDEHPAGSEPDNTTGGPASRPRPASPRPGIMEVRRQLSQALAGHAELRALVAELRLRIATLERRCAELEQQLQRALSLAESHEPSTSGPAWDAASAASVQERATILLTELEQVRRERSELVEQRDRLVALLTTQSLSTSGSATGPATDYAAARTELFLQIRIELEVRDQYAQWLATHRPRETDRRLDPTRTLDEQALIATIAVRWQYLDHAPHSFRCRPRWAVEGLLLDPASEKTAIRLSRQRVTYRQQRMAAASDPVA